MKNLIIVFLLLLAIIPVGIATNDQQSSDEEFRTRKGPFSSDEWGELSEDKRNAENFMKVTSRTAADFDKLKDGSEKLKVLNNPGIHSLEKRGFIEEIANSDAELARDYLKDGTADLEVFRAYIEKRDPFDDVDKDMLASCLADDKYMPELLKDYCAIMIPNGGPDNCEGIQNIQNIQFKRDNTDKKGTIIFSEGGKDFIFSFTENEKALGPDTKISFKNIGGVFRGKKMIIEGKINADLVFYTGKKEEANKYTIRGGSNSGTFEKIEITPPYTTFARENTEDVRASEGFIDNIIIEVKEGKNMHIISPGNAGKSIIIGKQESSADSKIIFDSKNRIQIVEGKLTSIPNPLQKDSRMHIGVSSNGDASRSDGKIEFFFRPVEKTDRGYIFQVENTKFANTFGYQTSFATGENVAWTNLKAGSKGEISASHYAEKLNLMAFGSSGGSSMTSLDASKLTAFTVTDAIGADTNQNNRVILSGSFTRVYDIQDDFNFDAKNAFNIIRSPGGESNTPNINKALQDIGIINDKGEYVGNTPLLIADTDKMGFGNTIAVVPVKNTPKIDIKTKIDGTIIKDTMHETNGGNTNGGYFVVRLNNKDKESNDVIIDRHVLPSNRQNLGNINVITTTFAVPSGDNNYEQATITLGYDNNKVKNKYSSSDYRLKKEKVASGAKFFIGDEGYDTLLSKYSDKKQISDLNGMTRTVLIDNNGKAVMGTFVNDELVGVFKMDGSKITIPVGLTPNDKSDLTTKLMNPANSAEEIFNKLKIEVPRTVTPKLPKIQIIEREEITEEIKKTNERIKEAEKELEKINQDLNSAPNDYFVKQLNEQKTKVEEELTELNNQLVETYTQAIIASPKLETINALVDIRSNDAKLEYESALKEAKDKFDKGLKKEGINSKQRQKLNTDYALAVKNAETAYTSSVKNAIDTINIDFKPKKTDLSPLITSVNTNKAGLSSSEATHHLNYLLDNIDLMDSKDIEERVSVILYSLPSEQSFDKLMDSVIDLGEAADNNIKSRILSENNQIAFKTIHDRLSDLKNTIRETYSPVVSEQGTKNKYMAVVIGDKAYSVAYSYLESSKTDQIVVIDGDDATVELDKSEFTPTQKEKIQGMLTSSN
jgi:hypothetical protein